jgi:hypothetical protein
MAYGLTQVRVWAEPYMQLGGRLRDGICTGSLGWRFGANTRYGVLLCIRLGVIYVCGVTRLRGWVISNDLSLW